MAELPTQQKRVWAVALTGIVLSLGIVTVLTVVWGVVMARPLPIRAERRTVIATVARPGVLVASPPGLAARVDLGETEAATVYPGAEATLALPRLPETVLRGRVMQVTQARSPAAPWPVYQALIWISLPAQTAAAAGVEPGLAAHVAITVGRAAHVLAVPNDALVRSARGELSVAVLRRGGWRMVPVQVGLLGDHYTQVRRGLQEGEVVRLTPGVPGAR
jgi:hypothetical protein